LKYVSYAAEKDLLSNLINRKKSIELGTDLYAFLQTETETADEVSRGVECRIMEGHVTNICWQTNYIDSVFPISS
jgi:hypothetical protein